MLFTCAVLRASNDRPIWPWIATWRGFSGSHRKVIRLLVTAYRTPGNARVAATRRSSPAALSTSMDFSTAGRLRPVTFAKSAAETAGPRCRSTSHSDECSGLVTASARPGRSIGYSDSESLPAVGTATLRWLFVLLFFDFAGKLINALYQPLHA